MHTQNLKKTQQVQAVIIRVKIPKINISVASECPCHIATIEESQLFIIVFQHCVICSYHVQNFVINYKFITMHSYSWCFCITPNKYLVINTHVKRYVIHYAWFFNY